jgi:hypothetical protein
MISILLLAGCNMKDDYLDCPTTGSFEIRVDYTQNIDNRNYFENEISRLDFFFFDENGLFKERVSDLTGPFVNGYSQTFDFPPGYYQAVIWGNLYDDTHIVGSLEKNVTTIEELQLKLVTDMGTIPVAGEMPKLENFAKPIPTTLFWGKTRLVDIHLGHHVAQQVDLLKNTHDIHITLRWKNYDGYYCFDAEHQKRTRAYIAGTNGNMTFCNELMRERNVTYIPLYRDPAHPNIYADQTGLSYIPPQLVIDGIAAVMPDARTMRLMADGSTEQLVVTTVQDDGTERIMYVRSIVDLIRLTGHYNTQRSLDCTNDFHIVIDFRCIDSGHNHGAGWIAVTVWVNGWVVKEINEEI